jgi:ATP-dependent Clp protease protease subunit
MNKTNLTPRSIYKPKKFLDMRTRHDGEDAIEEAQQEQQSQQIEFTLPYNLITINGEINEKTSRMVTDLLLAYDVKNQIQGWIQPIHLLINSPGGSVIDAWQICDIMDSIRTPVFTIGSGQIASAALTIFINGEKGFRVLSEHTSVMSHQYSWGVAGKMDDLVSAHREFNNIYNRMESHFIRKTGLSRKIIKDKLLGGLDNWMTAKEAKKMKLADQVFNFEKTSPFIVCQPPPELIKKQKEAQAKAAKAKKEQQEKKNKETNGKSDNTKK